ncbi:MAG: hypothetical protein RBG13Loki_3452 [Promethearchaeota archaeon CR_4]|nr:MAG: hypothetical protein RBG13Loki_3452 [Candidatus Lokiarchaeota archaeon CR_4]
MVIGIVSNLAFEFEDSLQGMREVFPIAHDLILFERIPNGFRINFLESRDFDIFFLDQTNDSAVREHYRWLRITSEEFFKEKQQSIKEILIEQQRKRLDKLAQKRKRRASKRG